MKCLRIFSIGLMLACIVLSSNGQTEKGKLLIGGQTNLNFASLDSKWISDNNSGDIGNITNLEFSPLIGFFVANGLVLGAELPLIYESEKDEDNDKYSSTSIAFVPFLRYYFGSGNVKPYLHGGIGLGNMKTKYEGEHGSSDDTSFNMSLYEIGSGLGIFLNEKVSLDIGLGYGSIILKPKENNDANIRSISNGLAVSIGLTVVL